MKTRTSFYLNLVLSRRVNHVTITKSHLPDLCPDSRAGVGMEPGIPPRPPSRKGTLGGSGFGWLAVVSMQVDVPPQNKRMRARLKPEARFSNCLILEIFTIDGMRCMQVSSDINLTFSQPKHYLAASSRVSLRLWVVALEFEVEFVPRHKECTI